MEIRWAWPFLRQFSKCSILLGGGASAGLAPDPFGIGFVCGDGGMRRMSPGVGDGRGFAARDSDFPIQVLRFINNRAIR